jgi:ribosomal protein S18 acetylase RimI-like enzyme
MSTTASQSDSTSVPPSEVTIVRNLRAADLPAVVAIDAQVTGRRREEFFRLKLKQALSDTGIVVSLGADRDGNLVGFLLARVYYGEFGTLEPVAVMDVIGVQPEFQGRGVGAALIDQLRTNLLGIGIKTLHTEVGWDSLDLIAFFHREGFRPSERLCLQLDLEKTRP